MHGRILQISKNPIPEENYIDECRYCDHWILSRFDYIVDMYTSDSKERREEIEYILEGVAGIKYDPAECTLTVTDKEAFFRPAYHTFMSKLYELENCSLEAFASLRSEMPFFELQNAFEDEFALYVDDNEEMDGVLTLSAWMRYRKNGDKVYLGSVLDYHR